MEFGMCLQFLEEYRWIFDFKVTEILEEGNLRRPPPEWFNFLKTVDLEEFCEVVMKSDKRDGPEFVQKLITSLEKLKPQYPVYVGETLQMTKTASRGLSKKKIHEVLNFTSFITHRCQEVGLSSVFDVGSGLGYIDDMLLREGLNVYGAESNQQFHMTAISRYKQAKQRIETPRVGSCRNPDADGPKMTHIHLKFDSSENTDKVLGETVKEPSILIALHACGDLTPDILQEFIKFKQFRCLSVVSCCYHKMLNKDNFPLSQALKEAVKELEADFLNEYFLRLGAQETTARWHNMTLEDHNEHSRNVVFRSTLELFAKQEGITLKKKRRKAVRKEDAVSFSSFVDNLPNSYGLELSKDEEARLWEIYKSKEPLMSYVEVFTGLQFLMQEIIEAIIIADRVRFLEEHGLQAEVYTIFDSFISPRNKVIVAQKLDDQ